MRLLVDLWADSLEPAYRTETARRAAAADRTTNGATAGGGTAGTATTEGRPASRGPGVPGVAALLALLAAGVLLATAASQAARTAPASREAREALLTQVAQRTAATDALQAQVTAQQTLLAEERSTALAQESDTRALAERLADLEVLAGATPVAGPGLRVTLDDAPPETGAGLAEDAVPVETRPGRLLDRDLQDVVNALWAAGAEAVAVEGQRLSALSAISNAGEAVLVDFRPTAPPYTVEAIGDPAELEVAFVDSPTGRRFATYVSLLGITFDVEPAEELRLPAAPLRGAPVATTGNPS